MQIQIKQPALSVRLRQFLPLIAASIFTAACGSDKTNNYDAAPTPSPAAATGAELYAEQCVSCHGSDGSGSTPIGSDRSQTELASFIETAMPQSDPSLCGASCSEKIAAFIVDNFYPEPFVWQTPAFTTAATDQGAALKVTGSWQSLAFEGGELSLTSHTGWQWLYRFKQDADGASACTEQSCLDNWQPIIVSAEQALNSPWGKIERSDNYWQVTFWGNPVYAKAGGGDALVDNAMWPALTPTPLSFSQGKLSVNGRLNTLNATGNEWLHLAERAVYLRAQNNSCEANCLNQWPALLINDGYTPSAPWGSIAVGDHLQWTYFGKPVYLYAGDNAGDILGDGIGDWVQVTEIPIAWGQTDAGRALVVNGQAVVSQLMDGTWQNQWQELNGRSLYTFANDTYGTSNCTGTCAENWPPLMASAGAVALGNYSLIARGDNYQWAWQGKPLYLFTGDTEAGMAMGHNPDGAWQLAGWVAESSSSNGSSSSSGGMDYSY